MTTEDIREAGSFEAWWEKDPKRDYTPYEAAEMAWQESRKQALEEAAKACEKLRDDRIQGTRLSDNPGDWCYEDGSDCDFVYAWDDAASAVRALKDS
jgi:hypothetical protein